MNTASVIVIVLVAAAVALAVRKIIKSRGNASCCGECSHCGCACGKRTD